jgi:co-chaperonin GroES (HSP10)
MNDYYTNKMALDEDSKAVYDTVIIKIIEQPNSSRKYGNIFLPTKHIENTQLIIGEIHSAGAMAKKENMNDGDLVFYDKGSAFGHPPETVGTYIVTYMENVIAKVSVEEGEVVDAVPYGERVMVGDYKPEATQIGDIYIPESGQVRSNLNTIHRIGTGNHDTDSFPVKEGDNVIVDYEKSTTLKISDKTVYIIDLDNVLAVVKDEEPKKKTKKAKSNKK